MKYLFAVPAFIALATGGYLFGQSAWTIVSKYWRDHRDWRWGDLWSTDGAECALGACVVITALRALACAIALIVLGSLVSPAQARGSIIVCDQQGCRPSAVPAPIVKPGSKIERAIQSRNNVRITEPRSHHHHGGKVAKINRGLMGEALSPMHDYRAPLEACGYTVQYGSSGSDANNADVVIVHSMGTFGALNSNSKRIFVIDAPIWASGLRAPHSRTMNFPTAWHPRVYGAINVPIPGGHIGAPNQAKRHILAALGCGGGGKVRHAAVSR